MASKVWILVQWQNESVFPEYGVHYIYKADYDEGGVELGSIVTLRVDNGSPRPAKIVRISDKKRYMDEQKVILEREDRHTNEAVAFCMKSIRDVPSNRRPHSLPIDQSKNRKVRAKVVPYGANKKTIKLFKDVETQTEDREVHPDMYPLLKKIIRKVIECMKKLDEISLNDSNTNNSQNHEEESHIEHNVSECSFEPNNTEYEQQGDMLPAEIADVGAEEVVEASDDNQTLNSSIRETEENVYHNDARVQTAHITHDDDEDLVTIGNGKTQVSKRLLQEIDWNSYTTATRQLLQGIFPRKVLATSCLTGKKSPAFLNKPAKKLLDPVKVDDIVTTVSVKCNVPRNLVRSSITIKCTDEAKLHRKRQQDRLTRMSLHQNCPPNCPPTTPVSDETATPDEAHRNPQPGMHPRVSLHQNDVDVSPSTSSSNETVASPEVNLHRNRQQGMRPRMSLHQNEETISLSTPTSDETVAPHEVKLYRNRQQSKRPRSRMSLHQNDDNIPLSTSSSNETVAPPEVKLYRNRQQSKRPRSRISLHENVADIPPSTSSSAVTVAPHESNLHRIGQQGKRPRMSLHQKDENIPPTPSSDKTVMEVKNPPNMSVYQNEENVPPLTPPSDDTLAKLCS